MIRRPAAAGMFYSAEPALLREQIRSFMLPAKTKPSCIGVISPHAGYGYSGKTAAMAMGSLKPAGSFIILGPNHTGMGAEFSLMSRGSWKTPLGNASIDEHLAAELLRRTDTQDDASAHAGEHSIEVQLPFLQYYSRHSPAWNSNSNAHSNFRFVPVCIMNTDYSDEFMDRCVGTGEVMAGIVKSYGNTGIVASSDFSHYVDPASIWKRERPVVEAILELDVPKFFDALSGSNASVCGYGPIAVLMAAAKKLGLRARDIDSSDSGGGRAVSYRAIGFE